MRNKKALVQAHRAPLRGNRRDMGKGRGLTVFRNAYSILISFFLASSDLGRVIFRNAVPVVSLDLVTLHFLGESNGPRESPVASHTRW